MINNIQKIDCLKLCRGRVTGLQSWA